MIKVELIDADTLYGLEAEINEFGRTHKIVNVSLTTHRDWSYCACIMYEKEGAE